MPPPLPQDPDKQPAGGGRGRAGSLQDLKWQVGQVRAGGEVRARAWGWGGWATTLPEPASLLPFQGEPPGWSEHAPGGQGSNSEERMQRQKTPRILPYLFPYRTQTHWPTPSPHPKLSQPLLKSSPDKRPHFWFSSLNQSHSPWAPQQPRAAHNPFSCPCARGSARQPEPHELPALSGESWPPPSSDAISRTAAQSHTRLPNAATCTHAHAAAPNPHQTIRPRVGFPATHLPSSRPCTKDQKEERRKQLF